MEISLLLRLYENRLAMHLLPNKAYSSSVHKNGDNVGYFYSSVKYDEVIKKQ